MTWLFIAYGVLNGAAAADASLDFEDGFVGPFALHPSEPLLAVVRERGGCYGGGAGASTLEIYALPELGKPKVSQALPFAGCTGTLQWAGAQQVVVTSKPDEKGRSTLQVYGRDGGLTKDLGQRKWGVVRVARDGSRLASVKRHKDEDGHKSWAARTWRTSDWSFDGRILLSIDNAKRAPSVVDGGFGMMTWADDKLWIYDIAKGVLDRSVDAPQDAAIWLKLLDNAAPGGESLVYVANDYQSGFERPFPKLGETSVPKHVLKVPSFEPWCKVSGDGIEKMRDWQQATLGSRIALRPGDETPALYQRSVSWDTLVAFLMPPVDQFRNPFGAGQTAFVIRTTGATCTASKVAELGRDPIWFDATAEWLVVTTDKDAKSRWFHGLKSVPLAN